MKHNFYLILTFWLLMIIQFPARAQYTRERLQKAREIDTHDYQDIKGSPYLYEAFRYCTPFNRKKKIQYKSEWVNLNGYEGGLEVKRGQQLYSLPSNLYDSLVIHPSEADSLTADEFFVKNLLPGKTGFVNVVYYGNQVQLVREFKAKIDIQVVETPGKTIKTTRFTNHYYYTLNKNGVPYKNVRLKKADLIAILGHKNELTTYIKRNKLNLNKLADVKKLLAYYETLPGNS